MIVMLIGWLDVSRRNKILLQWGEYERVYVVTNEFPLWVSFVRVHPMLSPSITIDMYLPFLVSLSSTKLTAIL